MISASRSLLETLRNLGVLGASAVEIGFNPFDRGDAENAETTQSFF